MKLELTPAALADLRSIQAYTMERRGAAQEEAYLDRMWEKFEALLADSAPYRFRPDLFPGCQIAAEGKHVILFRVNESTLQSCASCTARWISSGTFVRFLKDPLACVDCGRAAKGRQ